MPDDDKNFVVIKTESASVGKTVTIVDRSKIPEDLKDKFEAAFKEYKNIENTIRHTPTETIGGRNRELAPLIAKMNHAQDNLLKTAGGAEFQILSNTISQGALTEDKKDHLFNFSVGGEMSREQYNNLSNIKVIGTRSGKLGPLVVDLDQLTSAEKQRISETQKYVAIDAKEDKAYVVDYKTAEKINKTKTIPDAVKSASPGYKMEPRDFTRSNFVAAVPLTKEGATWVKQTGYELPASLQTMANIQSVPAKIQPQNEKKGVVVQQ